MGSSADEVLIIGGGPAADGSTADGVSADAELLLLIVGEHTEMF